MTEPQGRPFITIIVVTKNRAFSLARTLQTLQTLDCPTCEVLVVDDGSTDDTRNVVAKHPVKHIYCPEGYTRARQRGIEMAQGDIIATCDDDCVPHCDWLRYLVRRLRSENQIGLVAGKTVNIGFPERQRYKGRSKIGRNGQLHFVQNPEEADCFGSANMALKRESFEAIGGYDLFFRSGYEDADLILRMRRHGWEVVYEPQAIVQHYFTGVSYKLKFFYGGPLMRLYFYLKHFRPCALREWLSFLGYEGCLLGKELYSIGRQLVLTVLRGEFQHWSGLGISLFNSVSARLALPWLLWKAQSRLEEEVPPSLEDGKPKG